MKCVLDHYPTEGSMHVPFEISIVFHNGPLSFMQDLYHSYSLSAFFFLFLKYLHRILYLLDIEHFFHSRFQINWFSLHSSILAKRTNKGLDIWGSHFQRHYWSLFANRHNVSTKCNNLLAINFTILWNDFPLRRNLRTSAYS